MFIARQRYQSGILRWSWNEVCITIRRNSREKCYSLLWFRLVIASA